MDHAELRLRLAPILIAEEENDWARVEQLADELNREMASGRFEDSPEVVNHYLDDAVIRQSDTSYGASQRERVKRFTETGDYPRSLGLPWWFLGVVTLIGVGLIVWFVA
jgi:hypothetical protein